jgi:hypothetical protein
MCGAVVGPIADMNARKEKSGGLSEIWLFDFDYAAVFRFLRPAEQT